MTLIIGEGTQTDPNHLSLATKKRTPIKNTQRKERLPEQLEAARAFAERLCPGIKVRSLSATYNCVGLAFASRRTWVETDDIPMILLDDGYVQITERPELARGDVAIYRDKQGTISHIALVWSTTLCLRTGEITVECLSQWGADGEYFHSENNVPELLGKCCEFWSDRKVYAR